MSQFPEYHTFTQDALPSATNPAELSPVENAVIRQVDWYMGRLNLPRDEYLKRQMDSQLWVSLDVILAFPKMLRLGLTDKAHVASLLHRHSSVVEVAATGDRIRPAWARRSSLVLHPPPSIRIDQLVAGLQSLNSFSSASFSSSSFDASNHPTPPPVLVSVHPSPDGTLLATYDSPGGAAAALATLHALDLTLFGHRISAHVLPDPFLNPSTSTFSSSSTTPESPYHTPPPPPLLQPSSSLPSTASIQVHPSSTPIHLHSLPHSIISHTPLGHATHAPPPAAMLSSSAPLLTALPMGMPVMSGHPHMHSHHHSPHPHSHRQLHPHAHTDLHVSPFSLQSQPQPQVQTQSLEPGHPRVQAQDMSIHRQFMGARSMPPAYVMSYGGGGSVGVGAGPAVGQPAPLHHFDPVGAAAAVAAAAASLQQPQMPHPHALLHSHHAHQMQHPVSHIQAPPHTHIQPHPPLQQFQVYPQPNNFAHSQQQPPQISPYMHSLHPPTPPSVPTPAHGPPRMDSANLPSSIAPEALSFAVPTRNGPGVISNNHTSIPVNSSALSGASPRFPIRDASHQIHNNHPNNGHLNGHHGRNNIHTYSPQDRAQGSHLRSDRYSRGDAGRHGSHGSSQPGFTRSFTSNDSRGFNHRKVKKGPRGHNPMRGGHAFSSDSRYHDRRNDRPADVSSEAGSKGDRRFVPRDDDVRVTRSRGSNLDSKNFPPLRSSEAASSNGSTPTSPTAHSPIPSPASVPDRKRGSNDGFDRNANLGGAASAEEGISNVDKLQAFDDDNKLLSGDTKSTSPSVDKSSVSNRSNDRKSEGINLSYAAILRSKKSPSKTTPKADVKKIEKSVGKTSEVNVADKAVGESVNGLSHERHGEQDEEVALGSKQNWKESYINGDTCGTPESSGQGGAPAENLVEKYEGEKPKSATSNGRVLSVGSTDCTECENISVEKMSCSGKEGSEQFEESAGLKVNVTTPDCCKDDDKVPGSANDDAENEAESWTKVRGEWRSNNVWANKPKSVLEAGSRISSGSGGSLRSVPAADGQEDDGTNLETDFSSAMTFAKSSRRTEMEGIQGKNGDADGGRWVKAGRKHWNKHNSSMAKNGSAPHSARAPNPTSAGV